MNNRHMKTALIAATGLAFAIPTMADTATTTFQVTATVNDSCTVTATDLAFGVYDAGAGNLDGTSTITATCTAGTGYDIGLDAGSNSANASGTTRAMDDGGSSYLEYELYSDSSRSVIWGNDVGTDTVNNPSATGGDNAHTVYGQIPAGQYDASAATSYSDTINVTVTY